MRTKTDIAIARIQEFEPPEGYYLAFSGGKDSTVLYDLTVRTGVKLDAHYNVSGIDPPELVRFIKANYPTVEFRVQQRSLFKAVQTNGLPTRMRRWCCRYIKESGGAGRRILMGIRWAESTRRKGRRMVEACYKDESRLYVNPIIDWTDQDVWNYIRECNLDYCSLYDEGFERLGCILCPMAPKWQRLAQAERWPKIADAWKRAAIRYWNRGTKGGQRFSSGEQFFDWWMQNESVEHFLQQSKMDLT